MFCFLGIMMWQPGYGHNDDRRHNTHPQPCEPLLARWIAGAESLRRPTGHRQRAATTTQTTKVGSKDVDDDVPWPGGKFFFTSFHFLINETTRRRRRRTTRREGERDNGRWGGREGERPSNQTTRSNPAPAPSPASHCSWGGLRVLAADDGETTSRGRRNDGETRRRTGKRGTAMTRGRQWQGGRRQGRRLWAGE